MGLISRKRHESCYNRNYWPSGKLQDFLDSVFEYEPEADPNQEIWIDDERKNEERFFLTFLL